MKRGILDQYPDKCEQLEAYLNKLDLKQPIEKRRGYLIATLHFAQNLFGYLPLEVQELIADRLMLQQSDVYGVISFYSYFTDKPVGKYQIHVCTGTACFVKGADKILAEFKEQLKIEEGETTPDGKFSVGALRCVGACSLAPVVMVNDRVYGNVTPKMVKKIIADFPE
ncbi:MAG: NAD(P)H-dependent oxidoreductase subunit E [Lentisphaerae bacterium]|nr:MAG: NAD(P)H-dependent oxidoreductase subunit E [Lentisphaerota bacterium]